MRIKVNYSELSKVLGYVNTVLNDKTVDEKMKNIIFLATKEETLVVGYGGLTFSRTKISNVEADGFDEVDTWDFQVKAGELNKIISYYTSLNKTKVENIEFELKNDKIGVIVKEEAIKEEDSKLTVTSRFTLNNIPILKAVDTEIHLAFPSDPDVFLSGDLLLYIDSLLPLATNDGNLTSKISFGDEHVFIVGNHLNSFFVNKLPDSFKGVTLGYSSVNFLKKLCEGFDSVEVEKIDRYLCIRSGNTEAFLKYQPVKIKVDSYIKRLSKDNGIVLDRLYFKDVLKRMMFSAKDGAMKVTEEGLEVSNEGFYQVIPIINKKGDVDDIKFKASVPVLSKAILGDDSLFPSEIFIYFVKAGNGYVIYIKDNTDTWLSNTQVRI